MIRPKLFIDTNVCIDVANRKIPRAEWRRVQKYINANYRYYISWVTWKELLVKLARGSDGYFEQNKEPLRVLYSPAKRSFLPYPFVFAIRTSLGINVPRKYNSNLSEEAIMEATLKAIFRAPNKTALGNGIRCRSSKKSTGFDLDDFDKRENAPQNKSAELLDGIRNGTIDKPEPRKWAAWILKPFGLTPYANQCEKLAADLDAAYRFSVSLSTLAKDKGYDFRKRASNWGDCLQLFYLCDESTQFLTRDADFRNRAKNSPQSCRILTYDEFVRSVAES